MNSVTDNLISFGRDVTLGVKELNHLSLSRLRKVFSLMGKNEKIALAILGLLAVSSLGLSLRNFYLYHTVPIPSSGGSYSEGVLGQPGYINPLLANSETDLALTHLVFSGLYKYDDNGQLVPDLADGMPVISADQKEYTINIKRNAKWQNGKSVTADDVVFTIQTLQDPSFKSPLRPLWQSTTVQKLSDYTVQFTTKDVSGPFLQNLTLPILPQSLWSGVDGQDFLLSKYNLEAVGSGPYAIKEIRKLPSGKVQQITLSAFDGYYQGQPKLDQIVIKFYDTIDDLTNAFNSREVSGFGFASLSSNPTLNTNQASTQILPIPLPQYQVVFFNLNNPILSDLGVRQALALVTDRQQIINQIFQGRALLPVSPFVFNDPKNRQALPSTVEINQAKQLLDASGWTLDPKTGQRSKNGQPFSLTIATNDTPTDSGAAALVADQWRQLGIQVNVNVLPSQQLTDTIIKPRAFDVLLFPQKFGADPDPFLFWHSSQVKDPGFNLTGFSNPTADQLIVSARSTTDKQQRATDYQQLSQLILGTTPVIFLDQTEFVYVVDQSLNNIGINFLYDPSQRFYDAQNWYMDTKRVWK